MTDTQTPPFTWTCDKCHRPVANEKGYICCDWLEALKRQRLHDQRDREKRKEAEASGTKFICWTGAELLRDYQPPVTWEVLHYRCDPDPDRNDYWFAIERCRDLEDLLDWNAHLAEKQWLKHTDWFRFIQRRLAPNSIQRRTAA